MRIEKIKFTWCLIGLLSIAAPAQTGGAFTITQSVVAEGGGQNSTGGAFAVDGTIGQPLAGTNSAGGAFTAGSGFWQAALAPTAAGVSISGRVTVTGSQKGIRNVNLTLTNAATGTVLTARSGGFGAYRFDGLSGGQTYVLSVSARRFSFAENLRVITPLEDLTDIDFVGTGSF